MPIERAYAFTDLFALARAGSAWRINAAGALEEVAANALRVDYDPATLAARGALAEEAATNLLTNPRAEGAVAGSPGTIPTDWSFLTGSGSGITRTIVGVGSESGIPYLDVRYAGTTTAAWGIALDPSPLVDPSAAAGDVWSFLAFLRVVSGILPFPLIALVVEGGATPYTDSSFVFSPTAAPLATQRYDLSRTFTNGTTSSVGIAWVTNTVASGTVVDFTLRIGAPQLVKRAAPLSPVLPPVATPGASARAADDLSMTEIDRWLAPSAGTFVIDFTPGQAAAAANRGLILLDDGTANNRLRLRMLAANTNLRFSADVGGVQVATMDQASGSALTRHTARVSYGPAGWFLSVNGAAPVSAAGAIPPGLTRCLLGRTLVAGEYLNGWLGPRVNYYPTQYTDTPAADGFTIRTR